MSIERLYKYGSLNEEYSEELFSEPKIWLSCTSELNDPFECQPRITLEGGTKEQNIKRNLQILKNAYPDMSQQDADAEAEAMYDRKEHKDPRILDKMQKDLSTKVKREIGLYCLSKVADSILMWSHYANNHKGYCLEFEATAIVFNEAKKVEYMDDYPIIEHFNTTDKERVDLTFLTKHKGWEYEQERRIIDPVNGRGWRAYHAKNLKGIIFGMRMSDDDEVKIRKWVGRRGHAVQFYKTVQHERKYLIEVKEII